MKDKTRPKLKLVSSPPREPDFSSHLNRDDDKKPELLLGPFVTEDLPIQALNEHLKEMKEIQTKLQALFLEIEAQFD